MDPYQFAKSITAQQQLHMRNQHSNLGQNHNSTHQDTVGDSDFNLSQTLEEEEKPGLIQITTQSDTEVLTTQFSAATENCTQQDLKQGDVLYSDCKNVFMDLQKFKNENNARVQQMMSEMQKLIDTEKSQEKL